MDNTLTQITNTVPHVFTAINEVTAALAKEGISKDRKNQQQGYTFRGIDDVYAALSPLLAKHKLIVSPEILSREMIERTTQKGGALFYTFLTVKFHMISAVDGTRHEVVVVGEAMDSADKSTNKAMSAAYKYACFLTFAIPTEGDNDADAQTYEVKSSTATQKPKTASGKKEATISATTTGTVEDHPAYQQFRERVREAGRRNISFDMILKEAKVVLEKEPGSNRFERPTLEMLPQLDEAITRLSSQTH